MPRFDREWLSCTKTAVDAALGVLPGVIGLEEEPARIAVDVRVDEDHAEAATPS